MAEVKTIHYAQIKDDSGALVEQNNFSVDASNVFYEHNGVTYTLKQVLDNYMKFMTTGWHVYKGDTPPANHQIGIWIDTRQDTE